jgi:hypothetical protein
MPGMGSAHSSVGFLTKLVYILETRAASGRISCLNTSLVFVLLLMVPPGQNKLL